MTESASPWTTGDAAQDLEDEANALIAADLADQIGLAYASIIMRYRMKKPLSSQVAVGAAITGFAKILASACMLVEPEDRDPILDHTVDAVKEMTKIFITKFAKDPIMGDKK